MYIFAEELATSYHNKEPPEFSSGQEELLEEVRRAQQRAKDSYSSSLQLYYDLGICKTSNQIKSVGAY